MGHCCAFSSAYKLGKLSRDSPHRLISDIQLFQDSLGQRHAQRDRAEISSQIAELRATVEMQGDMIRRMMELMDSKGKQKAHIHGELSPSRN